MSKKSKNSEEHIEQAAKKLEELSETIGNGGTRMRHTTEGDQEEHPRSVRDLVNRDKPVELEGVFIGSEELSRLTEGKSRDWKDGFFAAVNYSEYTKAAFVRQIAGKRLKIRALDDIESSREFSSGGIREGLK